MLVSKVIEKFTKLDEFDELKLADLPELQFICKLAYDAAKAQGLLNMELDQAINAKQIGATRYLRFYNGRFVYVTNKEYQELKRAFNYGSTQCSYLDSDMFKKGGD